MKPSSKQKLGTRTSSEVIASETSRTETSVVSSDLSRTREEQDDTKCSTSRRPLYQEVVQHHKEHKKLQTKDLEK
jgi:hypothetical protein